MEHPDKRFNYLEKKTTIFFAGAVVLVLMFFLATGYKQNYFTRTTTLYFFSDNATGIKQGMSVRTLGFDIGEIKSITLEPNAKVKVEISVQSDYMRLITQDSHARLFKEGMIGESVIEITPGSQDLRSMAHNAVLPFERGRDLTELADELYKETKPILKGIEQTIATINNPEGDVQQTLHNVNLVTKNVRSMTESLSSRLPGILNNTENATKAASDNLPSILKNTENVIRAAADNLPGIMESAASSVPSILHNAENIAGKINDGLPDIMDNSRKSLENIRDVTTDVKQMTSVTAQELPQTLHDGKALVKGSLSIVNGVKESWPVRNLISVPQEQPLLLDSYVAPPANH